MSIGERVRAIREAHGDSLRDAERRTGVGYGILFRIEQGEEPRTLESNLRAFALGYNVDPEEVLDGKTPRGVFHWRIRRLPPGERLHLIQAPIHVRVKLLLDFIHHQFPKLYDARRIALAAALPVHEVEAAVRQWRVRQPDLRTTTGIAAGLHEVTSISHTWLLTGRFETEIGLQERIKAAVNCLAVRAQRAQTPNRGTAKEVHAVTRRFIQSN